MLSEKKNAVIKESKPHTYDIEEASLDKGRLN